LGSSTVRRGTASPTPVFVITGTSGAGKGTLERALLERIPELELAVSATTRRRRPGEVDGREYWFISDEEFDRKLAAGEFLEYVEFPWGQRSGTLRSEIDRIVSTGRVPLLDLETEGALDVKRTVPGSVTVFVTAPTFEENERRLRERATESEGEIDERLDLARRQLGQADEFDHVVVNDDLERAVGEVAAIVRRELAAAGTMSAP
jgi:guanylate kinase